MMTHTTRIDPQTKQLIAVKPDPRTKMTPGTKATISPEQASVNLTLLNEISGSDPKLNLVLSTNSANWGSYSIDYNSEGTIPNSSGTDVWSTWDVKDDNNNYFGTITISTADNNSNVVWENYVGGTAGYLNGVSFFYDSSKNSFELTAQSVCQFSSPNNNGSDPNNNGSGPFADAPVATPAVDDKGVPIVLKAQGDKIVDGYGREVKLNGVVRPSLEWNPQGQYLTQTDIASMASIWGANAIRLDLCQQYWLDDTQGYQQTIDAIIYYATQNKMAVILDLHWLTNYQAPMANKDSITFWTQIAEKYGNFGTVIFELYNEPYGISTEQWLNGDGNDVVGYQQLVDAVRGTGATNLLYAGGLDYAYQLDFVGDGNGKIQINDDNLAYVCHPYNSKGASGYTGPGGTFDNNFAGIIGKSPLVWTEYGCNQTNDFNDGNYVNYYNDQISYLESHPQISATGFAWWIDAGNPAFPTLIGGEWDGTYPPVAGGVYVNDYMQSQPGTKFFSSPTNELTQSAIDFQNELSDWEIVPTQEESLNSSWIDLGKPANPGSVPYAMFHQAKSMESVAPSMAPAAPSMWDNIKSYVFK